MWQALLLTAGVLVLIPAVLIGGLIGLLSRRFRVRLAGFSAVLLGAFGVVPAYRRLMAALSQPVPDWAVVVMVVVTIVVGAVCIYLIVSGEAKRLARRIPGEEGSLPS